ncbi:MAG: carotene hydroxylase [Bacteroidota bacterium]
MLIHFLIILASFFVMEFMAWFTHKFIMHGQMWPIHKDHHNHSSKVFFEKNDLFFLIFAIPSWLGIMFGALNNYNYFFYIGIGILLYGICYFLVHDIIIHQRFKWFSKSNNWYVKGIKRAHKIHHTYLEKNNGKNFGMLIVPIKYFKATN